MIGLGYRFRDKGRFRSKIAIFRSACFNAPLKGFALEFVNGDLVPNNLNDDPTRRLKMLTILVNVV